MPHPPTKKRKPACMWCIISIWQIVLESRFKIHSVQAVILIDSENPSAPQGHIISRDVYHSNRSGEQIMRRKVHRNLHTAHLTVNVDKFSFYLHGNSEISNLDETYKENIGSFNC